MVGIGCHCWLVATNDFPQVAPWNADMGGDVEATIENLKAKIALASLVCYNELQNCFCVFLVKLCLTAVEAEVGLATAASQRAFALVYVLAHCRKIGDSLRKLKVGNLPKDGLPLGRSEDGVLEDFTKDWDFFLHSSIL